MAYKANFDRPWTIHHAAKRSIRSGAGGQAFLRRPHLTDRHPVVVGNTDDKLLVAKQVADMVGIPQKAVYELGIPYVEISPRRYRWWRSVVLKTLAERSK